MSVTTIKKVHNEAPNQIWFIKLEDRQNNRIINPSKDSEVGDCHVVWVNNETEFQKGAIVVLTGSKTGIFDKVLTYIWQHDASDGNHVRYATDSYQAGSATQIKGDSSVGSDKELIIHKDGSVTGKKPEPA